MTNFMAELDTFDNIHGITHYPWQMLLEFRKINCQAKFLRLMLRHQQDINSHSADYARAHVFPFVYVTTHFNKFVHKGTVDNKSA